MKPAMTTCQICGRDIKASKGVIAHHGYQRPHQQGWQRRLAAWKAPTEKVA